MESRKHLIKCSSIVLIIMAGISSTVYAEGFNLDSVKGGLTTIQKEAGTAQETTQAIQQVTAAIDTENQAAPESLTDILVKQMGITTEQAQGGAGAIFASAKDILNPKEFANLSKSVPEMDTLLAAVPQPPNSGIDSAANELSDLGDTDNKYGIQPVIATSFEQLNISPDMADQFIPIVVDYVRKNGDVMTADLLQTSLFGL